MKGRSVRGILLVGLAVVVEGRLHARIRRVAGLAIEVAAEDRRDRFGLAVEGAVRCVDETLGERLRAKEGPGLRELVGADRLAGAAADWTGGRAQAEAQALAAARTMRRAGFKAAEASWGT